MDEDYLIFSVPLDPFPNPLLYLKLNKAVSTPGPPSCPVGSSCLFSLVAAETMLITWWLLPLAMFPPKRSLVRAWDIPKEEGMGLLISSSSNSQLSFSRMKDRKKEAEIYTEDWWKASSLVTQTGDEKHLYCFFFSSARRGGKKK